MVTEIDIAQAFIDRCVEELNDRVLTVAEAAKAKWWCTGLLECSISQAFADAHITRIYAAPPRS